MEWYESVLGIVQASLIPFWTWGFGLVVNVVIAAASCLVAWLSFRIGSRVVKRVVSRVSRSV